MATSQIRLMFHRIRLAAVGVRAYYLFLPGFYDNVICHIWKKNQGFTNSLSNGTEFLSRNLFVTLEIILRITFTLQCDSNDRKCGKMI